MTSLKKLTENLNLNLLNSAEASNLKGGRMAKIKVDTSTTVPIKGGDGGGLPPSLDSEIVISIY